MIVWWMGCWPLRDDVTDEQALEIATRLCALAALARHALGETDALELIELVAAGCLEQRRGTGARETFS